MPKSHNKKRNTGLLYEFLVRTISQALVDGDRRRSAIALKIVKRHFRPGTHLYREYRLINSLVRTTVSSDSIAASILHEAKAAARAYDMAALDREKSLLISAINKSIGDQDFYDQPVHEYRTYATVQTLLNDWRDPHRDIGRVAQYEDQLVRHLVTEKAQPTDVMLVDDAPGMGRLLMKVMMRKLNEKYAGILSDQQRKLLRAYAFSTANDDGSVIAKKLHEIKERLLADIELFKQKNTDNNYIVDKLTEAHAVLQTEKLDVVDDDTVTRFMLYTKLSDELLPEVNDE